MRPTTCLLCKHCSFSPYEAGYSEYTPSSPLVLVCLKRHWDHDLANTKGDLAKMLGTVRDCPDFVLDPTAEGAI